MDFCVRKWINLNIDRRGYLWHNYVGFNWDLSRSQENSLLRNFDWIFAEAFRKDYIMTLNIKPLDISSGWETF